MGDYGPRVTAGPYGVIANADPASGPVSFLGPRGGVLLGYEQPLSKTVSFVADRAEFTPPVLYSKENRAKLVFLVEAKPAAEVAARLNPGQPVDVTLSASQ